MAEEYKDKKILIQYGEYALSFKKEDFCSYVGDCPLAQYTDVKEGDKAWFYAPLDPHICWMCKYFIRQDIPKLLEK